MNGRKDKSKLIAEMLALPIEERKRAGVELVMRSAHLLREGHKHQRAIVELAEVLTAIENSLGPSARDRFERPANTRR
jgi:hypothetical protein